MAKTPKPDAPARSYRLKATLRGVKPPIWRQLVVPGSITLERLHDVLQVAMGWVDYHLHEFKVGARRYGVPDEEDYMEPPLIDERRIPLNRVAAKKGAKLLYEYDFGDGWEIDLLVEEIIEDVGPLAAPVCIGGRRAPPPEDSGGPWGYMEKLEIIVSPDEFPEGREIAEWMGEDFDAEAFDADAVTRALRARRRRWA